METTPIESIMNFVETIDGIHIVKPDKFEGLIKSGLISDELQEKIEGEKYDYDLKPVLVINKGTYTEASRIAQRKYRDANRTAYNEAQRKLYDKLKHDEEWKKKFNERSKEYNRKHREKAKEEEAKNPDFVPKKRGRPRKV